MNMYKIAKTQDNVTSDQVAPQPYDGAIDDLASLRDYAARQGAKIVINETLTFTMVFQKVITRYDVVEVLT